MTRDDLRALMAAIISVDPTAPGGTEYPLRHTDAILAETHPELPMAHELTVAPGPHSFYGDGSPVPTGHGDIVYVRSGASISPYVMVPTILRVIDEEMGRLAHPDYDTSPEVAVLRTLRSRFEPDTQGGDR